MDNLHTLFDLATYEKDSFLKEKADQFLTSDLIAQIHYKNGLHVKIIKLTTSYIVSFQMDNKMDAISVSTISDIINQVKKRLDILP